MKIQNRNENRLWNIQVAGIGKNNRAQISGSIFFGKNQDNMQESRLKLAQKQAMRVVSEANKNEGIIDEQVKELDEQAKNLTKENDEWNEKIKDTKKQRDAALEAGGLTEDDKNTREYQELSASYNATIKTYRKEISENEKVIAANAQAGYKIDNERLKSHAMQDAVGQKDNMMLAAAKDFALGSLKEAMDEAQKKIQEKLEEAKEKAAEKAEEEEKAAERVEEKEQNAPIKEHTPDLPSSDMINMDSQKEIQQKIKDIADNMNLLQEDLKGIKVDQIG